MNPRRRQAPTRAPAHPEPAQEYLTPEVLLQPARAPVPAPKLPVIEVQDEEAEEWMKKAMILMSAGLTRQDVVTRLVKEHAVDAPTARAAYDAAADRIREHLDSEGAIDTVMYTAAGRLHDMSDRFYRAAMAPIPEQVVDVLGPDADAPLDGAVWRPLRPGERASEMAARAQAAKVSISAMGSLTKIVRRRSKRWVDQPSVLVATQINNGLDPDTFELLQKLKMEVG